MADTETAAPELSTYKLLGYEFPVLTQKAPWLVPVLALVALLVLLYYIGLLPFGGEGGDPDPEKTGGGEDPVLLQLIDAVNAP
jgi:hypothetical protein